MNTISISVSMANLHGERFYNVTEYQYDRDFIRIHYIDEVSNNKCITVFPTHNVFQLDIQTTKGGENNAKRKN